MVLRGLRQERFLYFFRASVRNVRQFSVEVQLRCFAVCLDAFARLLWGLPLSF